VERTPIASFTIQCEPIRFRLALYYISQKISELWRFYASVGSRGLGRWLQKGAPFLPQLLSYQSGEAALQFLPNYVPDVILIDSRLPGSDGWDLLTALRDRGVSAPAIAMTADLMGKTKEKALGHGFDAFLAKPIEVQALSNLIEQLVDGEAPQSHISGNGDGLKKTAVTHISNERFQEIVVSTSDKPERPLSVLSMHEARHLENCPDCIDRMASMARQIFQRNNSK
jgi:CheY-like chemotaxis protein